MVGTKGRLGNAYPPMPVSAQPERGRNEEEEAGGLTDTTGAVSATGSVFPSWILAQFGLRPVDRQPLIPETMLSPRGRIRSGAATTMNRDATERPPPDRVSDPLE